MYIDIHTHSKQRNSKIKSIVNLDFDSKFDVDSFSLGIHPWQIDETNLTHQYTILKENLLQPNCMALGECGLDKKIATSLILQQKIFVEQLELNRAFGKPVIVHCVKAFDELISIKRNYDYSFIIHGFVKNSILANQLVKNGFYLSFGKALLSQAKVQEAFRQTPLDHLFLETDDAPESIALIYEKAAALKQISVEELSLQVNNNLKKVFYE